MFSGDRSIASRHASWLISGALARPVQANENEALVTLALHIKEVSRPSTRNNDTPFDVGSNCFHGVGVSHL